MDFRVLRYSLFSELDIYLFREGSHYALFNKLGAHSLNYLGNQGTYFAVWAPNATYISVICNFNNWEEKAHPLYRRDDNSGIWEGFIPHIHEGEVYKYFIVDAFKNSFHKSDPYAFRWEAKQTADKATIVTNTEFNWNDHNWMENRKGIQHCKSPISVYEVHLGSWIRSPENPELFLNYRDIAPKLLAYVQEMGFTHIELMPIMEHPYYPSWGYQVIGYFAASSFYGTPQDLMFLIDLFHQNNIGVILDWVPGHFPGDANGLHKFDGTYLYEHDDPKKGFHPEWKTYIFNFGRNEVKSFLISNAHFWLEQYHADGLRIDALASILYLDYGRNNGEWIPNKLGGNENLEAIKFIQDLNLHISDKFPDIVTIAEDSTSWPGVTQNVLKGGLGFCMKWMMGWMNDTLKYFSTDPVFRSKFHQLITFTTHYAFNERYMLPLSHDEVVHGKSPMPYKMWGNEQQQFAQLRLLYLYLYTINGTKLLFMGNEFGQTKEWNFTQSLDWHLLAYAPHAGLKDWVKNLNQLYKGESALFAQQFDRQGFKWLNADDKERSIFSFLRIGDEPENQLMVILNMTPKAYLEYVVFYTDSSKWELITNSDEAKYWGQNALVKNEVDFKFNALSGKYETKINIPSFGGLVYKKKSITVSKKLVGVHFKRENIKKSLLQKTDILKKLVKLNTETQNEKYNKLG